MIIIRGVNPFLSMKYNLAKHKYFREVKDGDPKKIFSVKEYIEENQKKRKYGFVFLQDQELTIFKM
ncbi:MAG: hypothetical protein LBM93_01280 [Oscillospiraceae bacterium]|jgi:hypothetical protein|nr:hypothetical protein [Oscillospiraceae bacterium]